MRTFFRRYFTHNRYVSATATPLDALQLDTHGAPPRLHGLELSQLYLDLRPFANRSPFTVRKDCSASRAHQVGARGGGGGGVAQGCKMLGWGRAEMERRGRGCPFPASYTPTETNSPPPFPLKKTTTPTQAFVGLNLRHLLVVDASNRVAGVVTRKDLDHAAGHGWWRMSAQAPKPIQDAGAGGGGGNGSGGAGRLAGLNGILDGFRKIPSYGFLRALVNPNGNGGNGVGNGASGGGAGGLAPPPPAATAGGSALQQKFGAKGDGGAAGSAGGGGAVGSNGGTPRSGGGLLAVGRDPNAFASGSPVRRDGGGGGGAGGGGYSSGGEEGDSLLGGAGARGGGGGSGGAGAARGGRGTGGGAGRSPAAL